MTDKTSKVAIVTGASRGIGAAVAERLAADGFTVKSAEALARQIEGKGGRALTAKADVSEPQAVRGMFDATEAAFGGVDVLVNNHESCKDRRQRRCAVRPADRGQSQGELQCDARSRQAAA